MQNRIVRLARTDGGSGDAVVTIQIGAVSFGRIGGSRITAGKKALLFRKSLQLSGDLFAGSFYYRGFAHLYLQFQSCVLIIAGSAVG